MGNPSGEAVRRGKQLRGSILAACAVCVASAAFAICMALGGAALGGATSGGATSGGAAFGMSALDVFQPETAWADLVAGEAVAQGEFAPQAQPEGDVPALGTQAEGSLELLGFSGTGVVGDAGSGYTLYVRDGDQANVTLKVKNASGVDLEYVTMVNASTYEEDGKSATRFEFPPYLYRDANADVTGAQYDKAQWLLSSTRGAAYYGFDIAGDAEATFDMDVNVSDLAVGEYDFSFQLGRMRHDYEKETDYYWPLVNQEVEARFTDEISLHVVVYRQEGAAIVAEEKSGSGFLTSFSPIPTSGLDFGTVDLSSASDGDLVQVRTVSAYNSSPVQAADGHGNTTGITVNFSGEATSGDAAVSSGPFSWGTIYEGTTFALYDTNSQVISPSTATEKTRVEYSYKLDATKLIAGTYTGNVVIRTVPRNVKFNGQSGNDAGEYRIPIKVTLTGTNMNLLPRATNLTAVPGDGQVELTWAPAKGSSEYTEYDIWRRIGVESQGDPDRLDWFSYEKVGSKVRGAAEEMLFVDGTAENGVTYSYTVICGDPYHGYAASTAQATPDDSAGTRLMAPSAWANDGLGCVEVSWYMNDKYGGRDFDGTGSVDHFNVYRDGVLVDQVYRSAVEDSVEYGWHDDGTGTGTRVYGPIAHSYSWSAKEPAPELYTPYVWTVAPVSTSGIEGYASEVSVGEAYGDSPVILSHAAYYDPWDSREEVPGNPDGRDIPAIVMTFETRSGQYGMASEVQVWRREGTSAPDTTAPPLVTTSGNTDSFHGGKPYKDFDVVQGKTYTYTLRAVDSLGATSDDYTFTVKAAHGATEADLVTYARPAVAWSVENGTTARLTFTVPEGATAKVYRNGTVIREAGAGYVDFKDDPSADGKYTYRVDCIAGGITTLGREYAFNRNTGDAAVGDLLKAPAAPALTGRTSGSDNVILTWTPSSEGGAPEGYHIYRTDAGEQKQGGRYNAAGAFVSWGNGRYMTIEDSDTLSFVDGRTSSGMQSFYYKGDSRLGRIDDLDWRDESLPHEYWITAYNRAGESEPSPVVVFGSHGEDKYGNAIAPENAAVEAPAAPTIEKAWIDWGDSSGRKYGFSPGSGSKLGGTLRVAWSDSGLGGDVDRWTVTFAGTHVEDLGNPPVSATLDAATAVVDAEAKLGTSANSPVYDNIFAYQGPDGELGRTIHVTVAAENAAGSAVSETYDVELLSFPRTRVTPGNGKAIVEWTDLFNDASTQVIAWEVWRKAEHGLWTCVKEIPASDIASYAATETIGGAETSYYRWTDGDEEKLDNGYAYQYRVIAKCADGKDRSGVVREVTPLRTAATEMPGAPTGLSARVVDGEIQFSWSEPATGDKPQYYQVVREYKLGGSTGWETVPEGLVSGGSLGARWAPNQAGTYRFFVYSYSYVDGAQVPAWTNPASIEGYASLVEEEQLARTYPTHSNVVEVTIGSDELAEQATSRPSGPTPAATAGEGQVTLTWQAVDGATWYEVERSGGDGAALPKVTILAVPGQDGYTWTDVDAEPGVRYRYRVTAYNKAGGKYGEVYAKANGVSRDEKAAGQVTDLIDTLPTEDDVEAADNPKLDEYEGYVEDVRDEYEDLTDPQKDLVGEGNAQRIDESAAVVAAKKYADQIAPVQALIDALPSEAEVMVAETDALSEYAGKIAAARSAYVSLPDEAQLGVKVDKLIASEQALVLARRAIAEKAAALEVDEAVAALLPIDSLTLDDRARVQAARAKYAALSTAQRQLVAGLSDLRDAEMRIAALQKEADDRVAAANQQPTVVKKANPLSVVAKAKKVKAKKVKKKKQTVAPITVRGAQGAVSYKVVSGNKKSKKALKVNAVTGKITVKKKTKKGTYKVKVRVSAAGNAAYLAGSKDVTVTVKVK